MNRVCGLNIAIIDLQLLAVLFGKWTDHVKSWQKPELGDRILYITYEEMVQVSESKVLLILQENE